MRSPPDPFKIFPLGETALTIEFGSTISEEMNQRAIGLCNYFDAHPFPGFIEAMPAYSSATLFYDIIAVRKSFPNFTSAIAAVKDLVEKAASKLVPDDKGEGRFVEIPISFDKESALDLESIAENCSLTTDEVIQIFIERNYRVYMLGFLPGFPYMGEVDERIATPRKDSPRTRLPKGSVGIAGTQTGIYPFESPGGWQIIGRTNVEMFTPENENLCTLKPGDLVKFVMMSL